MNFYKKYVLSKNAYISTSFNLSNIGIGFEIEYDVEFKYFLMSLALLGFSTYFCINPANPTED